MTNEGGDFLCRWHPPGGDIYPGRRAACARHHLPCMAIAGAQGTYMAPFGRDFTAGRAITRLDFYHPGGFGDRGWHPRRVPIPEETRSAKYSRRRNLALRRGCGIGRGDGARRRAVRST